MSSRTSTQLILRFTSVNQQLQLQEDLGRFKKTTDIIKKRRDRLQALRPQVKKQDQKKSFNEAIQKAQDFKRMDDHRISIEEFCKKHNTDAKVGLTQAQADRRLLQQGQNKLSEKKPLHWTIRYLLHMANFFSALLWVGAILCFIAFALSSQDLSNLYLALVLIAVVLISTTVQFVQNEKSSNLMQSFKNFAPPQTTVIRDGNQKIIPATLLVRGDLINIQLGKKIPADVRIIQSNGMKVDNSSLTGQTNLLPRSSQCTNPDNPLETKNIAFFSTLNKQGSGTGFVIFTGDRTFIGQIAGLASESPEQVTPLQKQINRFVLRLGFFAISLGIIVFVVSLALSFGIITALGLSIGITVANVPSGLLLQVTIALTLTAKRLAKKKVLAKNLQAVQTLGSTTCICSDKTGTLTMNKMTAANMWYNGKIYKAANRSKQGKNYNYEYNLNDPSFKALHQCAIVCSVAIFDRNPPQLQLQKIRKTAGISEQEKFRRQDEFLKDWAAKSQKIGCLQWNTIGDASQSALIKFFQPIEDIKSTREKFPILTNHENRQYRLLFDSKNKFAYSLNQCQTQDSEICLFTKGAPQKVWKMCTHVLYNGKIEEKDQVWQKRFKDANQFFGVNGQRVLGFAKVHLPKSKFKKGYQFQIDDILTPNFPLYEQTFVGAVSLNDPPRDSVPFAVTTCQAAGVKVIMVTGDQPVTACAIARKCNIIRSKQTVNEIAERQGISFEEAFPKSNAIVIHGDEITKMSFEDQGKPDSQKGKPLQKWLSKKEIVFARTSPAQKLIIVKACQALGDIVAVTGDGVNDSPAIKKADLGISMGITGTDVAKDAADMILLTDDFSAIVLGMQEGRKIFDNLKKAICYVMTSQISQIAPFIALLIFQFPPPVTTVVLLCIDLGTDLLPAVSYAYEPSELGIMTRRPRRLDQHLVTMRLMAQGYGWMGWSSFFVSLFSFFVVMNDFGFPTGNLMFKNLTYVYEANSYDVYDPTSPTFGNTKLIGKTCSDFENDKILIDWLFSKTAEADLRMTALKCSQENGVPKYTQVFDFSDCRVQQISPISDKPVCFTPQAAKYGQSAYFYSNVIGQIFNYFICKTRKQSVLSQGMGNQFSYFAIIFEMFLVTMLAFCEPLNIVFGTRDNILIHFGLIALPVGMIQITLDEIKKLLIRKIPKDQKGTPNFFERVLLW